MRRFLIPLLAISILVSLTVAAYSTLPDIVLRPNADGYVMDDGTVRTGNFVMAGPDRRGIVEFSLLSIDQPFYHAELSLVPAQTPLAGNPLEVWGYSSIDGLVTAADYSSGTYLGSWNLPTNWNEGAPGTTFNVTNFLQGVTTRYVGFNLRANGEDVFTSLEFNAGRVATLIIDPNPPDPIVPEPASCALMLTGLGIALSAFRARRRK